MKSDAIDATHLTDGAKDGVIKGESPEAKTTKKRIRRVKKAGTWERGYLCHIYWCGLRKMGVVRTGERGQWDGAYRWECPESNVRGTAITLERAKGEIESIVHSGIYQLDLFDDGQASGAETPASREATQA